MNTILRPIEQN